MNFNHDVGLIESVLLIDTTVASPLNTVTNVLEVVGTGALVLPKGISSQRPGSPVAGMFRFNTTTNFLEYHDGTQWVTLATGGNAAALQIEVDQLEDSIGPAVNADGTFNANAFNLFVNVTSPTSITNVLQQLDAAIEANDTLAELDDVSLTSPAAGNILYFNGSLWVNAAPGATSGVQPYDATLAALAAYNTNGILVQTAADTFVGRTIEGTAGNVVVTNGNGVVGNPTIDLADVGTPVVDSFVKITTDVKGRVTATSPVVTADVTSLVDSTYVNVVGDTMSGTLTFTGGATVTGLPTPVNGSDAVNKAYVDAAVSGLTWKNAVRVFAATNVNIASAPATIDGVTLANGQRVLLAGQTTGTENGIYVFNGAGAALTRATDADAFGELNGAAVFVLEGTTYADTAFTQTAELTSFAGQQWVQFAGNNTYTAGIGLDLSGNVFSVNLGAGITQLPSDEVGLHIYNYPGSALGFSTVGGARVATEATAVSGDLLALFLDGATLEQSAAGLKFRDSAALSVVGRAGNTAGEVADIVAGSDFNILRRSGTTVGFGAIDLSQAGAVGTSVLQTANGGTGLATIGAANTFLAVNTAGTALEYKTIVAGTGITVTPAAGTLTIAASSTLELYRENPSTPVTPVATGANAVAVGSGATASATGAYAQGAGSDARIFGQRAYANGNFATAGDAQHGVYVLRRTTTNNTSTEAFLDGDAATQRIVVPNNALFTFQIFVAGRRTDATGGGAGYKFEGVIRKDATNASITFVGTPSKTVLGETNAPWDATVQADTTTGALRVNVQGENAKTVRWVATVLTTEVTN